MIVAVSHPELVSSRIQVCTFGQTYLVRTSNAVL
jgi:hypothetical protein